MPVPSVLIVNSSADTREVLSTVLARRGLRTIEAAAPAEGLELARLHRPSVIVLDAEVEQSVSDPAAEKLADAASDDQSRLIVLGKIRGQRPLAGSHVIQKPYHFAPLIHTIERLAAKAA